MQTLSGHTSPETAYVVDDYPYGFRLRCSIRYWIETKAGFGQRVVTQTTNPKKGNGWTNKPKASTYAAIKVLYLDDQGYVQNSGLSMYDSLGTIVQFEHVYAAGLTGEYEQGVLRGLKSVATQMEAREAAREAARQA